MSRYFLHIRDGREFVEDPEGSELPDVTAHAEAIEAAGEITADQLRAGRMVDSSEFLTFDEGGSQIAVIHSGRHCAWTTSRIPMNGIVNSESELPGIERCKNNDHLPYTPRSSLFSLGT
jgi:hypothetical protein